MISKDDSKNRTDSESTHLKEPRAGSGSASEAKLQPARSRNLAIAAIIAIAAVAAILAWFFGRPTESGQAGRPVPAPAAANAVPTPSGPAQGMLQQPAGFVMTLSREKLEAAQIKTEPAIQQPISSTAASLRTTGTVASNQYKETPVFPIAGGIVRQVNAQLGDTVRKGLPLLTIFSTELANAQGEYLKMKAEFEEHEKAHHRTAELVEIGAASREDLEQHTARLESMRAMLASQRQQLIQLGMTPQQVAAFKTPDQVDSVIRVAAPMSGTVISRTVNSGEVVATGKELFRVADLSTVWVIGQIYEKDLAAVREGTPATVREGTPAVITTPAYPDKSFNGRVSYIDPRIDQQTRTTQVRIEVRNPQRVLKIGMYVDVMLGVWPSAVTASAVTIPKEAVQNIGSKQVVFVATGEPGVFIQRDIAAGPESGGRVPVYSGLAAGERVVTDGSFLLLAESLKQRPDQTDALSHQHGR